ncbi:hypothetical protein ABT297_24700 [Dactylosporangium sp. NPDC000555]|uniref:hypothetical protein n=1 Tax=Dactylosporangium sp. NPDC000555 TaxID=3154260 RepID=UPI00331FF1DE
MVSQPPGFVRAGSAATHLQAFVLCGISTVLLTRAYLAATGYPKIAGGSLHIAHVLWGGLLMMVALGVALVFLGRATRICSAMLGGAGFGLFVDEVGKFITEETDYFYRPAAGIIYLTFAVLVVMTQWLRRPVERTVDERRADAANAALTGVISGLTTRQRMEAVELVTGSERDVDRALVRLLNAIPDAEPRRVDRWRAAGDRLRARLDTLLRPSWTLTAASCYLIVLPTLTIVGAVAESVTGALDHAGERRADLVVIGAAVCTALLSIRGAAALRGDRATGIRWLRLALLTDLLVGQVFKFTVNQFAAVTALAVDMLVLWVLAQWSRRVSR